MIKKFIDYIKNQPLSTSLVTDSGPFDTRRRLLRCGDFPDEPIDWSAESTDAKASLRRPAGERIVDD